MTPDIDLTSFAQICAQNLEPEREKRSAHLRSDLILTLLTLKNTLEIIQNGQIFPFQSQKKTFKGSDGVNRSQAH